jgi:bifunctional non-homologous end joining protein LigD
MSLKEYIRKRDFKKTAEPKGKVAKGSSAHRFVIQKHAASHLHYDFRLEMDGALKSWAVPKGIPYTKGEKRLAVEVEDHPVSYIDFEGTIPKGQYGGGTVMVWDRGTYEPEAADPVKELAGGKLHFRLSGKKLKGEWYLVRIRDEKQWLLIKAGEDMKPVSTKLDDTSALSGQSMAQLGKGERVWQSNRAADDRPKASPRPAAKPKVASKGSKPLAPLKFVEPMKARLVDSAPPGDWLYEIKFDGFRALAMKSADQVKVLSRNEKDFSRKFPEVYEAVGKLKADSVVMDGEIVALDAEGRSSFQLLQAYDLGEERPPIFFYAFDLLELNGRDWRGEPVSARKAALEKLIGKKPGVIRFSASLGSNADDLLPQARKLGLEGLIGKRADSTYEAGRRSGAWIKLKLHHEQELVIGGYTNPTGARNYFGALLTGYYQQDQLCFAGKVGTGFNEALLAKLHSQLSRLDQPKCPFVNLPEKRAGRYGAGVTPGEMKRCHWVKPELVCQIKFSEWTRDGKLRQPVFLGLREDKAPRDVVQELPH